MTEHQQELTMGHVCEQTGLSPTSVRTYIKQFGLRTARTEHGHHRFPQETVPTLIAIKEKIQRQGWTYQQVQTWLKERDNANQPVASEPDAQPWAASPLEERIVRVSQKLDELADLVHNRLEGGSAASAERYRQLRDYVITEQVKAKLRVQGLRAWAELPEIKRTMRAGLFRRQEDVMKRETFIAEFIRERLEEQLERELGLRETAATGG